MSMSGVLEYLLSMPDGYATLDSAGVEDSGMEYSHFWSPFAYTTVVLAVVLDSPSELLACTSCVSLLIAACGSEGSLARSWVWESARLWAS